MEHFLFVNSSDSRDYFPKNEAQDFTIELNKELTLEGCWKIAITDIWLETKYADYLTVCCDISEPTPTQNWPVVRRLWVGKGATDAHFNLPYYLPVHVKSLKRFRVYIKGAGERDSPFTGKPLKCTFHLKKV